MLLFFRSFFATLFLETVTLILRFGFQLESTRDTASTIGTLTHGVRIHHGYLGIVIIIATVLFLKTQKKVYALLLPAGIALLFSDLIHHFLILWPIVGTPQFDFFY